MAKHKLTRRNYMDAILVVLNRCGGSATASVVQTSVKLELDRYLTEIDLGSVPSNPAEPRWRNDTRWAREQLVAEGFLESVHTAGWGNWRLTAKGRAAVYDATTRLDAPNRQSTLPRPDRRDLQVPADSTRQLQFLADVYRRAHETPVGIVDHPVLADVVDLLKQLLRAQLKPPTILMHSHRVVTYQRSGPNSPCWSTPVGTSTHVPNHMDAIRMREFIDGEWLSAVKQMNDLSLPEKIEKSANLDLLAALPIVTCLVAARSDWLLLADAAALTARATHHVLTNGARPGGLLGSLRITNGGPVASIARNGLFHRALTAWVQHLDTTFDDTLALHAAPLRRWLNGYRIDVGDPEGEGPRGGDSLWAWLFTIDPSYEVPREGGIEEAATAIEAWLPNITRSAQQDPLVRGALLWHPLWGWAVGVSDSRNRYDDYFSAYIFVISETMRFKFFTKTGWIDVERAVAEPGVPKLMAVAVGRVAELARTMLVQPHIK